MKKAWFSWVLFILLLIPGITFAEETPFFGGATDPAQKREVLSKKINDTGLGSLADASSFSPEVTDLIHRKMDLLKQVDLTLGQQMILQRQLEASNALKSDLKKQKTQLAEQGIPEQPPYDFFFLDKIRDEQSQVDAQLTDLNSEKNNIQRQLDLAQAALDDREEARRKIKEENTTQTDGDLTLADDLRLEIAGLESLLAREWLNLKKEELKAVEVDLYNAEERKQIVGRRLKLVLPNTIFPEEDLKERLRRIEKLESSFALEMEAARKQVVEHDDRYLSTPARDDEPQAYLNSLKREALELKHDLLTGKLRRSPIIREIWTRRYQVFNKQFARSQIRDWRRASSDYLAQLDRDYEQVGVQLAETRKRITAKDKQAEPSPNIDAEKAILESMAALHEEALAGIETSRKMHRKLIAEIDAELFDANLKEMVRDGWDYLIGFLDTEIVSVDDRPITIGKLTIALLLLIMTLSIARRLSRVAGTKIIRRFKLQEGPRQAVETLIYYALIVVMTLISLYVANVPLTLFTVLGGALAIGVGFGSQNIINNFISSLILMVEQPIRVGDLIEVGNTSGRVQKIGARCTHVRTFANVDILVPNSAFLEKNVVNATLSDDLLRTQIMVGVAYGTDTKLVERLLLQVVHEHELILLEPKPLVLFSDFGEYLLYFKLEFRTRLTSGQDKRVIESDVRHRIVEVFAEHKIAIDYPKREVTLNAGDPIRIDMAK